MLGALPWLAGFGPSTPTPGLGQSTEYGRSALVSEGHRHSGCLGDEGRELHSKHGCASLERQSTLVSGARAIEPRCCCQQVSQAAASAWPLQRFMHVHVLIRLSPADTRDRHHQGRTTTAKRPLHGECRPQANRYERPGPGRGQPACTQVLLAQARSRIEPFPCSCQIRTPLSLSLTASLARSATPLPFRPRFLPQPLIDPM